MSTVQELREKPCPSDVKRDLARMKLRSREQERVRGSAIKLIEHQEQTIVRQRKQLADLNRRAPVEVSEEVVRAAFLALDWQAPEKLDDCELDGPITAKDMRAAIRAALGAVVAGKGIGG